MNKNIVVGSPLSAENMENMKLSLAAYLGKVAKNFENNVLVIDAETGDRQTVGETFQKSYEISNFLKELGCKTGTVIGIVCENRIENSCIFLAAMNIGAICTIILHDYYTDEFHHAFGISQPQIVFCSNVSFSKIKKVQSDFSFLHSIINIDTDNYRFKYSSYVDQNGLTTECDTIKSSDTALIMYSSGTTGLPKGIRISHKSLISSLEIYRNGKSVLNHEGNIYSGMMPFHHLTGVCSLLRCFSSGQTLILIRRCDIETFVKYIHLYQVQTIITFPSILASIWKNSVPLDGYLSSVKYLQICGAPLTKENEEIIKSRFDKCGILQVFGMTETSGACIEMLQLQSNKYGTSGQLHPGMMAKVVNLEDGAALGPFQTGELYLKGPLLMNGYCLNEVNNNMGLDEDGWLHTGDIVYYDDDFYFFIVDRMKELIKYKSYHVPPAELEMLLMQLDAVKEAAVVGVPDEEAYELPRACIVKKAGFDQVTELEIEKFVEEKLCSWKQLRGGVLFLDELPKTGSGKINRKLLKTSVA